MGFKGYVGGFSNLGKGTPQGDCKDYEMRKESNSCIVELGNNRPSSSKTTFDSKPSPSGASETVMLCRSKYLKNQPLREKTVSAIKEAHKNCCSFVVGDMPGVDSQFIDLLIDIDADFEIFHCGDNSRIII